MADRYQSTALVNGNSEDEIRKADLDLLKKINEVASDVSGGIGVPFQPITSPPTQSNSVTLSRSVGTRTILIKAANLVAATAGPFVLTLTTGTGSTVKVPIAAFGDTILSDDLLFDIYVDSSGNVISKDWDVSGSNTSGFYTLNKDGTAQQRGVLLNTTLTQAVTFPVAFANTGYTIVPGGEDTGANYFVFNFAGPKNTTGHTGRWGAAPAASNRLDWVAFGPWRT